MSKKVVRVRRHYRKLSNGVSVVRQHSRSSKQAIQVIRQKYNISTPISINEIDNTPDDSLAYTDTLMEDGSDKPVGHEVNLQVDKIESEGESLDKVLSHELAHIIDKELGITKSRIGKNFMAVVKTTAAYKKLQEKGIDYEMKPEELLARAYAQHKTGVIKPEDVETGYAWAPEDFKLLGKTLNKIFK